MFFAETAIATLWWLGWLAEVVQRSFAPLYKGMSRASSALRKIALQESLTSHTTVENQARAFDCQANAMKNSGVVLLQLLR